MDLGTALPEAKAEGCRTPRLERGGGGRRGSPSPRTQETVVRGCGCAREPTRPFSRGDVLERVAVRKDSKACLEPTRRPHCATGDVRKRADEARLSQSKVHERPDHAVTTRRVMRPSRRPGVPEGEMPRPAHALKALAMKSRDTSRSGNLTVPGKPRGANPRAPQRGAGRTAKMPSYASKRTVGGAHGLATTWAHQSQAAEVGKVVTRNHQGAPSGTNKR
jgi:hypothetical protein